jgi:hypothetical protein
MPKFGPIKRRDLLQYLAQLGFEGPYFGRRHQFMVKGRTRLAIPNPHEGDISRSLLARLLREAGIDRDEWENL